VRVIFEIKITDDRFVSLDINACVYQELSFIFEKALV